MALASFLIDITAQTALPLPETTAGKQPQGVFCTSQYCRENLLKKAHAFIIISNIMKGFGNVVHKFSINAGKPRGRIK